MEWAEVVSDVVKIGLGAVISGFTGYFILKKTHENELEKTKAQFDREQIELKKQNTIKFASLAHSLTYQHVKRSCTFDSNEYMEFLHFFNSIILIAQYDFKIASCTLFDAVNNYICLNKEFTSEDRDDFIIKSRKDVNIALSQFHKQASLELMLT